MGCDLRIKNLSPQGKEDALTTCLGLGETALFSIKEVAKSMNKDFWHKFSASDTDSLEDACAVINKYANLVAHLLKEHQEESQ